MSEIDFGRFDAVTFDCYGTLIDWESGILGGLQPVLARRGVDATAEGLLERYGRLEAQLEAGRYLAYRDVVAGSLRGLCDELGFQPSHEEMSRFAEAVGDWPAFPDSAPALRRLANRFALGVITNCDDDIFELSNRKLGVTFDWVVTAEQVRSYKPSHANFEYAFSVIDVPRSRILHVAQSLYHDHVPAKALGMTTVWIDRRQGRDGVGATPPADATPDARFPSMLAFADAAGV